MLNARYVIAGQGEAVLNDRALGNAWIADSLIYVDGADAEMAALSEIDPAQTAVADRRFTATLGESTMAKTPGDTIFETTYAPNNGSPITPARPKAAWQYSRRSTSLGLESHN